jgi:DUF438 domain-containing protein
MTSIKAKNGKTVTQNVREILTELPEARNNDRLLFIYYWAVVDDIDFEHVHFESLLEDFAKATPPSSIQRARQIINYEAPEENLLPTNPKILELRRRKAEIMRDKHERMKRLGGVI